MDKLLFFFPGLLRAGQVHRGRLMHRFRRHSITHRHLLLDQVGEPATQLLPSSLSPKHSHPQPPLLDLASLRLIRFLSPLSVFRPLNVMPSAPRGLLCAALQLIRSPGCSNRSQMHLSPLGLRLLNSFIPLRLLSCRLGYLSLNPSILKLRRRGLGTLNHPGLLGTLRLLARLALLADMDSVPPLVLDPLTHSYLALLKVKVPGIDVLLRLCRAHLLGLVVRGDGDFGVNQVVIPAAQLLLCLLRSQLRVAAGS
mmetsp:Transcript_7653/g.12153  ORF Transcript_7653/g.12153 Transcript_7653/m.12153 type:complete len:254 (-) Transcript_7653:78-839(-)